MRDKGSCRGYLGSRERSRVSQSKKTVWADKASNGKVVCPQGRKGALVRVLRGLRRDCH